MRFLPFVVVVVLFLPWLMVWGLWMLLALVARPNRHVAIVEHGKLPRISILIPAHNEELLLPKLLASLGRQTARASVEMILVVADHCTDGTAAAARAGGATVLERSTGPRGKPAAVRDGLAHLNEHAPQSMGVLFLDADCDCSDQLVEALAARLAQGHRVLQSVFVIEQAGRGGTLQGSVRWGFLLKNLLRPTGLSRLGLPCQLYGSGMLFHRDVLRQVTFEDHLIEDVRMAHRLLAMGVKPKFLSEVKVTSPSAEDEAAITQQRLRWEGGQFQTWKFLPGVAAKLLRRMDVKSLIALMEWSAPPLVLTVAGWFGLTVVVAVLALLHVVPRGVMVVPAAAIVCFMIYLVVGLLRVGGPGAVVSLARSVPTFAWWKLKLYSRILTGRGATSWDRTPRAAVETPAGERV